MLLLLIGIRGGGRIPTLLFDEFFASSFGPLRSSKKKDTAQTFLLLSGRLLRSKKATERILFSFPTYMRGKEENLLFSAPVDKKVINP